MAKSLPITSCSAVLFLVLFGSETRAQEETSQIYFGDELSQRGEAFNKSRRLAAYLMHGAMPIHFVATSDQRENQKRVGQGIGQTHSFWYFETEASFRKAAMLDPESVVLEESERRLKEEQPLLKPIALADLPRIDPVGIGGSLVVSGSDLPQEGLDVFFRLAKGESAKAIVLSLDKDETTKAMIERIFDHWHNCDGAELQILRMNSDGHIDSADWAGLLTDATGVWIAGSQTDRFETLAKNDAAGDSLAKFVAAGNVIGIAGDGGAILAEHAFASEKADGVSDEVLAILPESIIDMRAANQEGLSRIEKLIQQKPNRIGYEMDAGAAMIVHGRRIWKVGEGVVRIRRHAGQSESPVEISLSSERDAADLVALRRAARDCIDGYPAQFKPRAAKVDSGTLIIIGGGGMPAGMMQRFVDLAGGKQSHIVVLPTAMPDPVGEEDGIASEFTKLGAKTVTVLPSRTLDKVESEAYLSAFKQATGIWFGGGRQWRFVDAYLDTKAHALMHDVLRRGGVIMGSSAGASIQAEFLARGNPLGNLDIMADGYQRGLGFLPGTAIDQHFSQRNRQRDMLALVQRYPAWLGIGVDESTALIVRGEVGEVAGRGQVYFFDATTGMKEITPIAVAAGKKYDMTRRIAIRPPAPPDAEQ